MKPIQVPGRNSDPATDPRLMPLYIGAILAYGDAYDLEQEHGADHPAAIDARARADAQLLIAFAAIQQARRGAT
ncbi:MAG: hypothetical protein JWL76_2117 [Thermoleophilia bacterium]|nr:hypothetical protein [Thermoleophilia bacterium]